MTPNLLFKTPHYDATFDPCPMLEIYAGGAGLHAGGSWQKVPYNF